jgi:hypothetical protein
MNTVEYPEKECENHPSQMWEWDGYVWICVSCVLDCPTENEE